MCLFKLQSFSIFTQQRTLSDLLVGVEILLFEYFRFFYLNISENISKERFNGQIKWWSYFLVSVSSQWLIMNVWEPIFANIWGEKSVNKIYIYICVYGSYINKYLVGNSNDVSTEFVFSHGTITINFFQNKTIEEDEKCQHIFKHTAVRNRFVCVCVCVINSTIYLRGIYRKIFFNLAEFHCLATNANAPKSAQRTARLRRGVRTETFFEMGQLPVEAATASGRPSNFFLRSASMHNFSRLWLSQWAPDPNFGSTKPDQYPTFFWSTQN